MFFSDHVCIVVLGKAQMCFTPILKKRLWAACETVSVLVWLVMVLNSHGVSKIDQCLSVCLFKLVYIL